MNKVRFLHTSDWQLGMRRHFLGDEALPRYMQARVDAVRALARIAAEERCELVVVAGDGFESNHVDRLTVGRALGALKEIPCPVYVLPGNHDAFDAAGVYRSPEFRHGRAGHIHILESNTPVPVRPGLEIVGVPWMTKHPRRDLVAEALKNLEPFPGGHRLCVAHGIIEGLSPDQTDPAVISRRQAEAALADGRIHFLALGDRHSTTEVAPRIWYSGTPETTDFGELDPGNVLVVELDGDTCRVERRRTGTWRFLDIAHDVTSAEEVQALAAKLDALPDKDRTIVKLSLRGTLNLRAKGMLDDSLERFRHLFAAVELWERHTDIRVLPDGFDFGDLGLSGFAKQALDTLSVEAGGSSPDTGTARDALALLYRLSGGGRQ